MFNINDDGLDDEERAWFESRLDPDDLASSLRFEFAGNRGERDSMDSAAHEMHLTLTELGRNLGRRFYSNAKTPEGFDSWDIKDRIVDSAVRRGYCIAMKHAMMLLAEMSVILNIPGDDLLPDIPRERKIQAPKGIVPTVDELEANAAVVAEGEEKAEYEGDYVVAKGRKYRADDILALISEASILNDDLTKQGQVANTKIAKARAMFPGKTDDEVIGSNFKIMTTDERKARSFIREYRNKKLSQAETRASLKAARREDADG